MPDDLCFLPAGELAARLREGELSPVTVVDAFLARIAERNPALGAYVTVLAERARSEAEQAAPALAAGTPVGPLHGVPVAVGDLFDGLAGVPNTLGCRLLADFVPSATATSIERLQQAGAIVLGTTNCAELGHKGATDNALFGPTSTPFALGRNAGGAAGGSAAAVADGLCALAQGSDLGGSLRVPAAFCGVVGLKPSSGRVASAVRPDAFLSSSAVQPGPLARTVADAALMLGVMAGSHPRDPASLPDVGTDWLAATRRPIDGLRVAYSADLDVFPIEDEVRAVVEQAAAALAGAGATLEPVRLGLRTTQGELCDLWLRQLAVLYATLAATLKTQGLDLLGSHRDELSPQLVSLIERGRTLSAVAARLDEQRRGSLFDAVQDLFARHDVLVLPTVGVPPFLNDMGGETLGPCQVAGVRVDPRFGWSLAYPFSFTGHPAASVPAGLTASGLPVGLQIVGRRFADDVVLAVAAAVERVRPWAHLYPGLAEKAAVGVGVGVGGGGGGGGGIGGGGETEAETAAVAVAAAEAESETETETETATDTAAETEREREPERDREPGPVLGPGGWPARRRRGKRGAAAAAAAAAEPTPTPAIDEPDELPEPGPPTVDVPASDGPDGSDDAQGRGADALGDAIAGLAEARDG